MTSFFEVMLDTQATLGLEFEAGPQPNTIIIKLAADADTIEAKLWGSIDPTDPITNGNYSETQGGAEWFEFDDELLVRVVGGEGQKTFSVQVRDDVWNESSIRTIQFGTPEEKVEPAERTPGWPGGVPPREVPRSSRTIERSSRISVRTQIEVERDKVRLLEGGSRVRVRTGTTVIRRGSFSGSSIVGVGSSSSLQAVVATEAVLTGVISNFQIIKRRGQADDDAILALLL